MQGILERDENSDDFKSFSDGIDDFNGRDFGLSLAGPVITMPAALMLIFCL